jgi:hypothetical protein
MDLQKVRERAALELTRHLSISDPYPEVRGKALQIVRRYGPIRVKLHKGGKMSRIRNIMIGGVAFLVYIHMGQMINPWAFAVEDVDLVIIPAQPLSTMESNKKVSARAPIIEVKRGEFVRVEAIVRNEGAAKSGPFEVGIYLSGYPDGRDRVHEFAIIRKVELSGSEQLLINEEYLIPYKDKDWVSPGRNYFVVIEVDYDREVSEKDENKRKVIKTINVPCDEVALGYGKEFLCRWHD